MEGETAFADRLARPKRLFRGPKRLVPAGTQTEKEAGWTRRTQGRPYYPGLGPRTTAIPTGQKMGRKRSIGILVFHVEQDLRSSRAELFLFFVQKNGSVEATLLQRTMDGGVEPCSRFEGRFGAVRASGMGSSWLGHLDRVAIVQVIARRSHNFDSHLPHHLFFKGILQPRSPPPLMVLLVSAVPQNRGDRGWTPNRALLWPLGHLTLGQPQNLPIPW